MAPDSISAVGEALKHYMLPSGLLAAGIVVLAGVLLGWSAFRGLHGFGRAMHTAALWQPKPTLDQVVRACRAGASLNPSDFEFALSADSEAFSLEACWEPATPRCTVQWRDVRRIVAFKCELFKCDCVYLRLTLASGAEIETNEGVRGWKNFINVMRAVLPGAKTDQLCFEVESLPSNAAEAVLVYEGTG